MKNTMKASTKETCFTLVLPSVISPINWGTSNGTSDSRVIKVDDYRLLMGALHGGVKEFGHEIARVILDRAVDATGFLRLVCNLPVGFRGDVLFVDWSGQGFLSAVGRGDDRVLYSLSAEDVDFYRSVHGLGVTKEEATLFSENIVHFESQPAREHSVAAH